jgi:molybdopterin converting factor small subunit
MVKIRIAAVGDLREYFGRDAVEIALPENATLRDLLEEISRRWGVQLPNHIWDHDRKAFRGPTVMLMNGQSLRDPKTPLGDGGEIRLMHAIVGG